MIFLIDNLQHIFINFNKLLFKFLGIRKHTKYQRCKYFLISIILTIDLSGDFHTTKVIMILQLHNLLLCLDNLFKERIFRIIFHRKEQERSTLP